VRLRGKPKFEEKGGKHLNLTKFHERDKKSFTLK